MNKFVTSTLAIIFLFASWVQAQTLEEALDKTMTQFNNAQQASEMVEASNRLAMIAEKWNKEWIAPYYAAFSKVILSYTDSQTDKKDQYLDTADQLIEQAKAAAKEENDELYVLEAMAANARLAVDPQNRWQQYGKVFEQKLKKAKSLREDNPRIYYLRGSSLFYTPENFGGGKKAALPYFEKAASLYEKENETSIMKPSWGKEYNAQLLENCKSSYAPSN